MPLITTARARFFACTLLVLASSLVSGSLVNGADSIGWQTDYTKAAEIAARERKLLLLHFYFDACTPCRKLEANVFPRPEVAAAIHAAYVPVKIDIDKSPELARKYQIARFPHDLIVTPNGLEVYRDVSPQDPAKYVAMLNSTAASSGSALASRPSPAQGAKMVGNESMYDAGSDFQSPTIENGPGQYSSAGSSPAMSGPETKAVQPQNAPYGASAEESPYAAANGSRAPERSQYESDYAPAASSGYTAPTSNGSDYSAAAGAGSVSPAPQANPYVAPAPAPAPEKPETKKTAGLPPLGMDGYCVITLATRQAWTKGDKRFGAIHRGRLYLFGSGEAQQMFLSDPDRFSPALSGYDAVVFAETGKLVEGVRSHGLAYNGQMYLFSSEEALARFEDNPAPYAETVYQALLKNDNGNKYR